MEEENGKLEFTRRNFKWLLAQNPNYFGTAEGSQLEVVKAIAANVNYEEITCVGLNPRLDILEATVAIKRSTGYLGSLCTAGSVEYVRFYLDYGSGWEDAGSAAFNVHDIPSSKDCAGKRDKPLVYTVTHAIDPKRFWCKQAVLPRVRAILSWNALPPANNEAWTPVWGNVLERHVQIQPRPLLVIDALEAVTALPPDKLKIPAELKPIVKVPIPQPDPPPFELAELAHLYRERGKAAVEPHRFGFTKIQAAMVSGVEGAAQASAQLQEWKAIGLDWTKVVVALEKTKGNVNYEELDCLGLDSNREWLCATFEIKRPKYHSDNIYGHDFPMVQGVLLFLALARLLANLSKPVKLWATKSAI